MKSQQGVSRITDDEDPKPLGKQTGVYLTEQVQGDGRADQYEGHQWQDGPPKDVAAVADTLANRGQVVGQRNGRYHDMQWQDQGQQRDGDEPGAKADDAADEVGGKDKAGTQGERYRIEFRGHDWAG